MKHKHLSLLLLLALPLGILAQQPWGYASLDEAYADETYLILPPAALRQRVEKAAGAPLRFNTCYHLSGPYRKLGRTFVRFTAADTSFLLPEGIAAELLPHMVSRRYWERRYQGLQQWAYVDMRLTAQLVATDTTDYRYGRFAPVVWLGYRFVASEQWPVEFLVRTNTAAQQTLTLAAVERLAEWGAFSTAASQQAYEAALSADKDSELRRQTDEQRTLDSLSSLASRAASQADSMTVALQADSAAAARELVRQQVEQTKRRMDRDEIFIMNIKPARSDYMFGLEFNLYNCFRKTVSKVEISVAPINDREQVQRDKFDRTVRTVRCMGPIRPGSPAQYTFDELFWDDSGRIRYLRVTSITFHFTDGSTRTFTGYRRIMKHSLGG